MEHIIADKKTSHSLISLDTDCVIFMALIVFLNLHLVGIGRLDSLIFLPDAVMSGHWWRLLTHAFVHVSWYHLFLDASAFFVLYSQLYTKARVRIFHVGMCGAFSLASAWIWSPDMSVLGLCGLSGIAHGLMAVVSLDMIRSNRDRLLGWVCLAGVLGKSIAETVNGGALFSFVHAGLCGMPIVACHLGGVIGGLVSYGLYAFKNRTVDHG